MSRCLVALLLAASLLTTGCVARGKYRGAADVVNGALVVGGLALAVGAGSELHGMNDGGASDDAIEGLGQAAAIPYLAAVTVIGLGVAVAGGVGFAQSHLSGEPDVAPSPPLAVAPSPSDAPAPARTSYAMHLTAQARVLATSGQCGAVRLLDADVAAADGDYHARVFRTDASLAPCLAAR